MVRATNWRALALQAVLLVTPLAACSVASAPRLAVAEPISTFPARVMMAPAPEGQVETELSRRFNAALQLTFSERGVAIVGTADHQVMVTIVQRPAEIGITPRKEGIPVVGEWLSEPRKHRWFHACRAQRFEATLLMQDVARVGSVATARGAFDACQANQSQVEGLARTLVAGLLGR
jgi:hypothetical protein